MLRPSNMQRNEVWASTQVSDIIPRTFPFIIFEFVSRDLIRGLQPSPW